jgi:hypothetical protein
MLENLIKKNEHVDAGTSDTQRTTHYEQRKRHQITTI